MAGENEDGQTLLVAAEGVEGVEGAEGGEGAVATDSDGVMYVTREDGQVSCCYLLIQKIVFTKILQH